ncbi:ATP-dependent RecD-like DNA helicase [Arthrobacter sp. AZCC_0090]|uniref:ATP-dependent DNA helicase n=1 Tax=Arthrobacter sp. AZCC_0090 TaxID=2735881 RepID=UPI001615A8C2|nr:AAA family ATPase [Arthrobacter sp. AZCC_0090]MBB6403438.1 hypothetical protein [Arthrobacter sp. AZCC_0090]
MRRSKRAPFRVCDFTANWIETVASLTRERVAARRATWNRWNLLAEAERVCADIRCHTPEDRKAMIDAVATAAETQSVPLNENRYTLPANALPDLVFAKHSIFDFHGARLYTDAATLANEDIVMGARNDDGAPIVSADVAMENLASYKHRGRHELHTDQRAAAANVLLSGNRLDAVVGPAGTGKTTALGALKAAWEAEFGAGTVVGLAPAAASAEVLGRELSMVTDNVAKWLYESVGQGAGSRAARFFDAEQRLKRSASDRSPQTTRLIQKAARLAAEQDRWRFHPNQLVVVDEASMVSTPQLSALVQQARDAGAKLLLVGDPGQLDAIDAGGLLGWLDRQGKTVRLSTVLRFEQLWEQDASLKFRAGDSAAIDEYERNGRIRHGAYLNMVDQAYLSWQADIHDGKSSILIAADNDTVSMLNQRAQADRVIQGVVDAEQTVPLSDGLRAGTGVVVIARHNDRSIVDSSGDFIRNGTMLDVVRTGGRHGSLTAVRRDTGAAVTLGRDHVESAVELGYATTAHRSQGITVDAGHTVVTQGGLTRELFYVSMTRGRGGNNAYISENEPTDHEPLDPSLQSSWREILEELLAAEGAERAAHEIREAEQSKADSLERLSAEYDYLAQIAAAEDLARFVERHAPELVDELRQSQSWGATVAAWRRSTVASRATAEHVVLEALETIASAQDPAAVLHSRLLSFRNGIAAHETDPLTEPIRTVRPDVAKMIGQVVERIKRRTYTITKAAQMLDTEWKRNLLGALPPTMREDDLKRVIGTVALYRDRWGVDDSPLPLGPIPEDSDRERLSQTTGVQQLIAEASRAAVAKQPDSWFDVPFNREPGLRNVGWQL